ncbi:MAG TPA: carboxypeptidase regulatory-like domain-containing protein [Longimicrobiaceae bacterium]|nr:carboxypeptidase regulatory-like domain-containing protein [Longimicrobiaceae bacterium]
MNSTVRNLALLALALLAAARTLDAQTVRGALTEAESGRPVAGAFVLLLDTAGKQVAGSYTDADGSFLVQAPAAGSYTLRAERVGQGSVRTAALQLAAGQTVEQWLEMPGQAVQLEGLVVQAEKRRCATLPEAGAQTAAVWEETRKALSSTAWTNSRRLLRYTLQQSTRQMNAASSRVEAERSEQTSGLAGSPFVAVPVERLVSEGFVREDADSAIYYAPDAQVLLSDEFLQTHCFRVQQGGGQERGLAGLAFEPVRGRRLPDIRGVLWLDPATAELRHLEYTYTGLDLSGPVDRLGGRVEFERLPSGEWIVPRWRIRMPVLRQDSVKLGMQWHVRRRVASLTEVAGEVLEVRTAGGDLIRSTARAALAGTVWDSTRAAPLAGARVRLVGTSLEGSTDAEGRFRIDGVPEGRYSVDFTHPRADSLEYFPRPATVDVGRDAPALQLAVPPLHSVLAARCTPAERRAGTGVVAGVVRQEGAPVPPMGTPVVLAWPPAGGVPAGRTVAWTDALGHYHACAVPLQVAVEARAGGPDGPVTQLRASGDRPTRHDLAAPAVPLAPPAAGGVRLAGRIVDAETKRPVAGAAVQVDSMGTVHTTTAQGEFVFEALKPGSYAMTVFHEAYGSRVHPVEIRGEEGDARVELPLARREIVLEPLVVTAAAPDAARIREARARGIRRDVVARAEIESLQTVARNVGDLVRRFPGISITDVQREGSSVVEGVCVRERRRTVHVAPCAAVVVDDQIRHDGVEELVTIPLVELESVEWLPPIVAQARYGTAARGGALVVYTGGNGPHARRAGR